MRIYLIEQEIGGGYDSYDSAVVIAKSPKAARKILPGFDRESWCPPEYVKVTFIGYASPSQKEGDVVCASFNAG